MGFLDYVSAILSAAALIPGVDSLVDLISIPVDLFRGDLISAGFDLVGIVPFIREIGDAGMVRFFHEKRHPLDVFFQLYSLTRAKLPTAAKCATHAF